MKYVLEGREVRECTDPVEWAEWFEKADRRVGFDTLEHVEVSTVFLGLDHGFGHVGEPILFETMVFRLGTRRDLECIRYATWEEAELGHAEIVKEWQGRKPSPDDE